MLSHDWFKVLSLRQARHIYIGLFWGFLLIWLDYLNMDISFFTLPFITCCNCQILNPYIRHRSIFNTL